MPTQDPESLANDIGPSAGSAEPEYGSLLEQIQADPKRAAENVLRDFDESTTLLKPLFAQWKINRARMAGYTGMRLVKVQNEQRAFFPLGSTPSQSTTNKAARLCRRLRATIFTDPAVPDAVASSDDDEDRDAAETSTRVLLDVCDGHNIAYNIAMGDAFDLAATHGSGFIRFWIDPSGGGKDEQSGEWIPAVRRELMTGRNVRFIPDSASDLWDAQGVMIGSLVPMSELRRQFGAKLDALDDVDRKALTQFRPQQSDELLPVGRKDRKQAEGGNDALAFVLTIIHKQDAAQYPEGCYAILVGGETWVHSGPWVDPRNGSALDLPLTQVTHVRDEDNPYGRGTMEFLGPGNEVRQSLEAAIDEHLRRFTQRKTFVPIHSNLQPEQLQSETRTYIPIVPGGAPVNEDVPDFPRAITDSYAAITQEMDDESGLQQTGQGVSTPSVQSGKHAQAIISQVNVGLSTMAEYAARAIQRGWEVILQQIRAFVDTELVLRWQSEGGEFKVRRWQVSDLGGTTDVRIQKGSFTQLSSMHKAEVLATYMAQQLLPPLEAQRLLAGQVGGIVGLQDNPYRQRVRRQIAIWEEGPPEGWQPQPPQVTQDPQTGMPVPAPPQPDPVAMQIFAPLPVDEQPDVAAIRAQELGRALSGVKASRKPTEWRLALESAYEQARVAAGIQTVQDQQRAQQAQMQQQQQMQMAQAQQQQAAQQQESQMNAQVGQAIQEVQAQLAQLGQVVQQTEGTVNTLGAQTGAAVAGIQRELDTVKQVALAGAGTGNGHGAGMGGLMIEAKATEQLAGAVSDSVTEGVTQVVGQQVGASHQGIAEGLEQIQQILATLLATRPTGAKVLTDKSGKITGVEVLRPEPSV